MKSHLPGEPHKYELKCTICGGLGVIRVSIDPPTAAPWFNDDDGDHSAFTHRDDDEEPPYE